MSEDSEKEDYSDRTISDDESDEDNFMKFVSEDIHQCALLTADSISDPFFPRTTQILLEYQLGRWVPRLREPRDLYGVSSSGPLSPTRWPYHCEVIDEKVQHIDWTPSFPEPVYTPTGLEMEPLYPNSKENTVVYLAEDAYKEPCFVYSRVGGNRTSLKPPADDYNDTLTFEARFESGNLQKVVKVAEYEYQLTLRPDLFTNKHTQWYYFQVTNTQAGIVYRFTIINFTKPASLYNRGMRPLFYSEKEAKTHNIGWQRIGDQIKYYRNNQGQEGRHYFSLTWTFQFPHNKDTCYFAHCYPYTYTNLQEYLSAINHDSVRSKFCKIRVLCHTMARNMVYVLTITTPLKNTDSRKRKAVILTARVHPGETNSSWIMKGFLDYILGNSSDAQLLRDTFIFKVVPMLNPDGVIVGNYRCSLAGRDLNRNYTSLLKESFPSVWYTRNMIHRLMEKREVILYCDLHGHSRKENIFMYGCDGSDRCKSLYLQQRIFPLMLSKNCPDKFSFSACKFNVQKSKEGTGRVVMWKMGIRNSFTMEATFCGSTLGNKRGTHFNTKDLESMGYHFCDSLLDYCDPDRTKYYQCLKELEEMEKHINLEKILEDSDTSLKEMTLDLDSSSRGSDSSESNESQTYLLKLTSQIKNKKKHLKTKKERNSSIASHQNTREEQEACDKGHLVQRHRESDSEVKDIKANVSDDCIFDYFRRSFPNQDLDLRHNFKSRMKECTSFPSKKTGINWTDDEKRIYRDKRIAQTQEILQYLLPIMESTKNVQTPQKKQILNPRTNFQIQHQQKPVTYINVKRFSTSWTPPRNHPLISQRNLTVSSLEWLQSVSQSPLENLSPLKVPKKKKKHSRIKATKTKDVKPVSSKWETYPSSLEKDADISKEESLQAEECNEQNSLQIAPHPAKNKDEQPSKKYGQPAFYLNLQRDK
ncbi:cytosolic carboxypeptidase 3 isoform X2 [Mustela putorius furo]|uniref:Cytosolic carboxypeptidase 3 isoform X2 n=1 Tax=Mustela putorius furo TaxID=9669 RepID=A0A8U0SQL5_MUSPF|nr:cytosolic carboxypeptidase 3 isoform X2 [Mustela putorius furo]